jgi:hypothetical protein
MIYGIENNKPKLGSDILTEYNFTSKQYLQFDGNAYIVLEEGDKIQITTEAGSTFSFIATFEVFGAQRT